MSRSWSLDRAYTTRRSPAHWMTARHIPHGSQLVYIVVSAAVAASSSRAARLKYPGNRHEPLRRLLGERLEILECLRTTGDDCYVLKVAATSMAHLEELVDALAEFGSTTTNLVLSRTLPPRGPQEPRAHTRAAV